MLARLGVDTDHEGHGLGAGLLRDVIARTHALGEQIGCRALLVHAECDGERDLVAALDHAHRALAIAADAGLRPLVVDTLEVIATLLHAAARPREAARLLSACAIARDEMMVRYRFPHRAQALDAALPTLRADDGWQEGAALSLDDAVELAQRMRGERLRPAQGWDSLTPTELQVIEQVAEGLSNPTVKTHLVHVFRKLGISNRAELAAAVIRRSHQ